MVVFNKISELKNFLHQKKQIGHTIGFVPTMGALHKGHLSLIECAKMETNLAVCSIFVNPTQFNNKNDLEFYPRTPEQDIEMLKKVGCDVLYMPEVADVYKSEQKNTYSFGYLSEILEAEKRPGHFDGVGQVVSILFEGVNPDKAYFGKKDYQQVMVVKDLVKQMKLNTQIIACPIVRELDGLAMSSRNVRLSAEERVLAANIPKWMKETNTLLKQNKIDDAKAYMVNQVSLFPKMKLDYYEVCDADSLKSISDITQANRVIALIAVFVGEIRLIDNLELL